VISFKVEDKLKQDLASLKDNDSFSNYKILQGKIYKFINSDCTLNFLRIQGSADAYPASLIEINIPLSILKINKDFINNKIEQLAFTDFVSRQLSKGIKEKTKPLKGFGGNGSFQPPQISQEVLFRNIALIDTKNEYLSLWIMISLPSDKSKTKINKNKALDMLTRELSEVIKYLFLKLTIHTEELNKHMNTVETYFEIRKYLKENNYIAFIGNNSILPRKSSINPLPLDQKEAIPFKAPSSLTIKIKLKNGKTIEGLGIPKGVTVITGAAYHGKSTLLNALIKGIYPHIPGDGRENVVTLEDAVKLKAEDGRSVRNIDLSFFIKELPIKKDIKSFSTNMASGSTSQAASMIEFLSYSISTYLIDEDDSATNFLMTDKIMKEVISNTTLLTLSERISLLKKNYNFIIISGANSNFLSIADTIIEMKDYQPIDIKNKVKEILKNNKYIYSTDLNINNNASTTFTDNRILTEDNFNAEYRSERHNYSTPVRIKLNATPSYNENIINFGNESVNLKSIETLAEKEQLLSIGWLVLYAKQKFLNKSLKVSTFLKKTFALLNDPYILRYIIEKNSKVYYYLSLPRKEEIIAFINRISQLNTKKPTH